MVLILLLYCKTITTMKTILYSVFIPFLFICKAFSQVGFVFSGCSNNDYSYSSGQLFSFSHKELNLIIHEGLQQSYLTFFYDTVLVFQEMLPYHYRSEKIVRQEGDTTFYLLPTRGGDSVIYVKLFSIRCPHDTIIEAPYNTDTISITLFSPQITPRGDPQIRISTNEPLSYAVGDTTMVIWSIENQSKRLSCEQTVIVQFPLCGDGFMVTDANHYNYQTVRIGSMCWLKENLKSTKYDDNQQTIIPVALVYRSALYPDTVYNLNTFGRLYSWYSAMNLPEGANFLDSTEIDREIFQGACPKGWRIPTYDEFLLLVQWANGDALRTSYLWLTEGNNISGFSALPGGYYQNSRYYNLRGDAYFWTQNNSNHHHAWVAHLSYSCSDMDYLAFEKNSAMSVRCIKQ